VAGKAFTTGQPQVVPDVKRVPDYFQGAPTVRSELNVPVKVAGRVVAVLNAESARLGAFDEGDLRLFEAVAAQLGIVLENARLYQSLQEQRDELSQAYEELKEIDRLRTELVQNVSHELRTPFTLVMGYIELLMAGDLGPLTEKQREALYVVRKRVDALQRRTRDLTTLDTLSGKEAKAHPTSIVDVVHTALAEVKRQATVAGVQLCEQVPDTLSPVMANKEHLVQAVTHLIDNAVKFSPDGGTVTVRAWEEDGHACIAVDDEGIGIEPQHLDHVFKRFYQVDGSINRRFSGMGVGLAVVWEIIEVYGGTVDVESTPNEGSSFIISLPRADENDFQRAISLAQAEIEKVKGPSA
jgi:signal transduction histidine kinase